MNLNEECQTMFHDLSVAVSDLPESQLATLLMTAALRAMKDQDYRLQLPLKFTVTTEEIMPVSSRR